MVIQIFSHPPLSRSYVLSFMYFHRIFVNDKAWNLTTDFYKNKLSRGDICVANFIPPVCMRTVGIQKLTL